MPSRPNASTVSAGLLAAFVGFTSSFAVILQGLQAVGASKEQAASGLLALSVAMGLCAVALSLATRMPILIAWSTPGAALLAGAGVPEGGFPVAVGAFVVAALLVIGAGLVRPLGRAISAIPAAIANAMLAGVLFSLCLAPVKAIGAEPLPALAVAAVWLVVMRLNRLYAVPAAALVAGVLITVLHGAPPLAGALLPEPVLVVPHFTVAATIGIALPLFLVTMASQNIPGLAILQANGYAPPAGRLFAATGFFSLLATVFGGCAVNLAAITAAICAGEEAGPDRTARYWASVVGGLAFVAFGIGAAIVTAFAGLSPLLVQAVAGLALIGAFAASLRGAMEAEATREAATLTFLVTASGVAFLGISAPFWGLVAGGVGLALRRLSPSAKPVAPDRARRA
ncbi:benzoate/H(+) symporter BenE family transporter [Aurantimonas sp. Leaf443]|uniref:benzoate/H(+) symporter BenE family transporter n=1 Tax=Aurantimonas sp. Leaf443 TaxID=1736378 RepID=UPI0006F92C13|nr:benzoate/H(+) symporter BenE family transporter [Aurantimonas sp. Leaf443]KQT82501.1 benzoate transporter [Aurantimonas sp. Leaf443]